VTEPADGDLLAAFRDRRDERAFARLYDRHTPYLWRFALRLSGGDDDAAQEIVHEAWVRAAARLSTFDHTSAFRTWLAGFALNVARELARRGADDVSLDDVEISAAGDAAAAAIARVDLDRALHRLPPGYRQLLVLHDIEGFTHEHIASMLGIQPGTSKSQLARARQKLRLLLDA
jgi:RNA polymerase sigma-70 factor (ECF subfamily)